MHDNLSNVCVCLLVVFIAFDKLLVNQKTVCAKWVQVKNFIISKRILTFPTVCASDDAINKLGHSILYTNQTVTRDDRLGKNAGKVQSLFAHA